MMSQASWLLLLGLVSIANTALEPAKMKPHVPAQESFVDQCTPVPTWNLGGERVVSLIGQNITVIAVLNSSRPFGRQQAAMLNLLRNRFYLAGFPDINFMVINSMLSSENTELLQHDASSIPVYQELPGEPVKDILGAGNDHVLVFDRCGRMAYQVISPFSKLTHPYVKAAILSTYKDRPCGFCNITQNEMLTAGEDTTQIYASDAPSETEYKLCPDTRLSTGQGINANRNETMMKEEECPYGANQERENGLPQSFTFSTASESQTILQLPNNTTVDPGENADPANISEPRDSERDAPIHVNSQMEKSELLQSQQELQPPNYFGQIKNWDWSERQNQSSMSGEPMISTEQSVEVIHDQSRSREKKKKKKKKHREKSKPMNCASTECRQTASNDLLQNISRNSNSYEASDSSMEKLVNETQKLIDWYQQQIETGEEEYERNNVLKVKIIDHYRKLLPWLNFKLAPKIANAKA